MRPSRSDERCSFPLLSMAARLPGGLVVMDLVEDAAALGGERTVLHARRPAGVGRRVALLAATPLGIVADDQVALRDVDLLPVIVHEGLGGKRARLDLQQPRAATALAYLVEIARQDLLVEARRVARRPLPAALQIDLHELEMLLGLHADLLHASSLCIAWCVTVPVNAGKRLKSSRAAARSGDWKARSIASAESNSSCASSTARPRLTAKGSCHSSGVWSTTRFMPGQHAKIGT